MGLMKLKLLAPVSITFVLGVAGPASASCVMPPPTGKAVREAEIAFIGTVTATSNHDRWATVAVEEIWKGEDLDPVVEIKAGPADPPGPGGVASSVERTFQEGVRYLFFPYRKPNGTFTDSACSNTTRFTPDLERFRPPGVRELSSPDGGDDVVEPNRSWVTYMFVGAGAGLVVSLVIVFARRRITD